MKRPRLRARCYIPLGVLLLPPTAWLLLLLVMPTGWARARIVTRLTAASGRPIVLGKLHVGMFGGLHLGDLTVASPKAASDPWLKVGDARINVSLVQLLCGQVDPTDLRIDGLTLRVVRRADGTFEMADSSPTARPPGTHDPSGDTCEPSSLHFSLTNAKVTVVDEPTGTKLELKGVEGRGVWEGRRTTIHELRGTLNGGRVELAATLDRTAPSPAYDGQLRIEQVTLDPDMNFLCYLAPVLAGKPAGLEGRLDLNVYVRGTGTGRDDLRRTLAGRGSITLDPIRLDGSPLLADLVDVLGLPPKGRVGSARSDFTIKQGRVVTDPLKVDLGRVPLELTGWTDFDGRLAYRLRAERLTDRLPDQARDLLTDLRIDVGDVTNVEVRGDLNRVSVTLDGRPLRQTVGAPNEREKKLRDLSRKVRDRVLR